MRRALAPLGLLLGAGVALSAAQGPSAGPGGGAPNGGPPPPGPLEDATAESSPGVQEAGAAQDAFPHEAHEGLFPVCVGCHVGVETGNPDRLFPPAASCGECHDGARLDVVEWSPPEPRISNLRFSHVDHRFLEELIEGEVAPCQACHAPDAPPVRMQVAEAPPDGCLACHAHAVETHLAPEARCDFCHVPLTDATGLPLERVAGFPYPAAHEAPDFVSRHAPTTALEQRQCATCHARESCEACHVNADRLDAITALGRDERVAELAAEREAVYPLPETHRERNWPWDHGSVAAATPTRCGNCHTQASCRECHIGEVSSPDVASAPGGPVQRFRGRDGLIHVSAGTPGEPGGFETAADRDAHPTGGPPTSGGGEPPDTIPPVRPGVEEVIRTLPTPFPGGPPGVDLRGAGERVHPPDFDTRHAAFAATGALQCTTCHSEQYCADCHAGADSRAFHPENFLERHAAEVFAGMGDCSSCHSTEAFCRDCHVGAGVAAQGTRSTAFHSSEPVWILTHGQAARIGLASCASCHGQSDCLECHSNAGWGVNPHGPGFDAESMGSQSPAMCAYCHIGGPPGGR